MHYSTFGMFNVTPFQTARNVGNNETIYSQANGYFKGTVLNSNGSSFPIILAHIFFVSPTFGLCYFLMQTQLNIISVKLGSSHGYLTLTIGPYHLTFDKSYQTGVGHIIGVSILCHANKATYLIPSPITIETFHQQLFHPSYRVCKTPPHQLFS
jgi:hypothetical protein